MCCMKTIDFPTEFHTSFYFLHFLRRKEVIQPNSGISLYNHIALDGALHSKKMADFNVVHSAGW